MSSIDTSTTNSSDSEGSGHPTTDVQVYATPPTIEQLESEKGKRMFGINGFQFHHHYRTKLQGVLAHVMQCSKAKKNKCKMKMWVSLSSEYVQHRGEHIFTERKTRPRHLQIPPDLQQLNGQPFVFHDLGPGKNRAIGMSTPHVDPRKEWSLCSYSLPVLESPCCCAGWNALTTNSLESWHHKTTEAANKFPKKSIWYLLHHAKNELGEVSKQRVIHLNQGVGVREQTRVVQQKKIQLIQEAVRKFDIQKLGDSLARMANSIDGINVEELSIEDA
uniref:Uncharacterized protein n=1 Tax=Ditylenchus dipsaci TaxID=166011 RepID=A0A915EAM3_9BILA